MIEYAVIAGYLLFLVAIGLAFRSFNSNVSDYFRAGCRGTWWLVGTSAFMNAFSAWTFTGAAGSAFESGWSVSVIFLGNVFAFALHAAWLAPWFRQLRAVTSPEIIRLRFGPATQQAYAWLYAVLGLLYASVWLWSLSVFIAAVFELDAMADAIGMSEVQGVIVIVGVVVLLYSVIGGSWAVMATDVIQSLVLVPLTLLVAYLCLEKIGGFGGLFAGIREAGLEERFAIINEPGDLVPDETKSDFWKYTAPFAFATLLYKVVTSSTIEVAQRYFGVKDGPEARKAALLAGGMMLAGMLFWFIPPIVARLLWADEVLATEMSKPAEAAYAIAGLKVLPIGLIGIMVVATLSATMSSIDSGLNKNAAVFVQDIYPAAARALGRNAPGPRLSFILGQVTSLLLGLGIIGIALYFAGQGGRGVFEVMLNVGAMISLPMAVPLALALFVRRVPAWAAMASVGCTMVPSAFAFAAGESWFAGVIDSVPAVFRPWLASAWPYHTTVLVNVAVGVGVFLLTIPFWRYAPSSYRAHVDEFFARMHRPVDFAEEVGTANDDRQLIVVGSFAALLGSGICALVFVPGNDFGGRVGILFVGGFVAIVGVLLILGGRRRSRR